MNRLHRLAGAALILLVAFLVHAEGRTASRTGGPALSTKVATTQEAIPTAARDGVLWRAGHEDGDQREWWNPDTTAANRNAGGGEFDSTTGTGAADAYVTTDVAHTGRYALALRVTGATGGRAQAVRMFRWRLKDSQVNYLPTEAYYSVWFYFPQHVQALPPNAWWNVFEWKSRDANGVSQPATVLHVNSRYGPGRMNFYLQTTAGLVTDQANVVDVPVGRWFQVEAYYKRASDATGRVTVWQDGVLLFDVPNLRTQFTDDLGWAVDNYADDLSPGDVTIYADDAAISSSPLGH